MALGPSFVVGPENQAPGGSELRLIEHAFVEKSLMLPHFLT